MNQTRLREFRKRSGLTLSALAALAGTTAAQVGKLEKGERRMTVEWMQRLAPPLGVEAKDLLPPSGAAPSPRAAAAPAFVRLPEAPRDLIPVRSAARGGDEQEMFLRDGPIDFIRRPGALAQVAEAYAIYMLGDSMFPRFRQGQLLHVNPFKPPQPGTGVVVVKRNDAVLIKEFLRRDSRRLVIKQYNPEQLIEVPNEDIVDLHTIVGLEEP
jgi:phage repressor protein C with HTH and peptisase S24 domain